MHMAFILPLLRALTALAKKRALCNLFQRYVSGCYYYKNRTAEAVFSGKEWKW